MKRLGQLLFLTLFIGCASTEAPPEEEKGVLDDVLAADYGASVSVSLRENILEIQVFNFDPYGTDLTESQRQGLEVLSAVLFDKMESLNLGSAAVAGHANPTGVNKEEDALIRISQARAETMAEVLRQAGITVSDVQGMAGHQLLGDADTEAGRGLNRRVEIKMEVSP